MRMSLQYTSKANQSATGVKNGMTAGVIRLPLHALRPDGRGPPPKGEARRAALALAPGSRESKGNTKTNKAWEESGRRDGTGGAQDAHR